MLGEGKIMTCTSLLSLPAHPMWAGHLASWGPCRASLSWEIVKASRTTSHSVPAFIMYKILHVLKESAQFEIMKKYILSASVRLAEIFW